MSAAGTPQLTPRGGVGTSPPPTPGGCATPRMPASSTRPTPPSTPPVPALGAGISSLRVTNSPAVTPTYPPMSPDAAPTQGQWTGPSSLTKPSGGASIMMTPVVPLPAFVQQAVHAGQVEVGSSQQAVSIRSRPSSAGPSRGLAFPGLVSIPRSATCRASANLQTAGVRFGVRAPGNCTGNRPLSGTNTPGRIDVRTPRTRLSHDMMVSASRPERSLPAVASSRSASPRISSPRVSPPRIASPQVLSPRPEHSRPTSPGSTPWMGPVHHNGLYNTWSELLDLCNRTRRIGCESPKEPWPPDPGHIRQACHTLIEVVNNLPDDMLRRVLTVLIEELFSAIFRDYNFTYDPREGDVHPSRQSSGRGHTTRPPLLSAENIMNAVPYFAVVQSLRDAAKDAIMRRLELEAKISSGVLQMEDADSMQGSPSRAQEEGSTAAIQEVRLREELRHAKLLAETYQSRTIELERDREEMEDEIRRGRMEREKEESRRQRLHDEIRRLRSELQDPKASRTASVCSSTGIGTSNSSTGKNRGLTPVASEPSGVRSSSVSSLSVVVPKLRLSEDSSRATQLEALEDRDDPPSSTDITSSVGGDILHSGRDRPASTGGASITVGTASSASVSPGAADVAAGLRQRRTTTPQAQVIHSAPSSTRSPTQPAASKAGKGVGKGIRAAISPRVPTKTAGPHSNGVGTPGTTGRQSHPHRQSSTGSSSPYHGHQ